MKFFTHYQHTLNFLPGITNYDQAIKTFDTLQQLMPFAGTLYCLDEGEWSRFDTLDESWASDFSVRETLLTAIGLDNVAKSDDLEKAMARVDLLETAIEDAKKEADQFSRKVSQAMQTALGSFESALDDAANTIVEGIDDVTSELPDDNFDLGSA